MTINRCTLLDDVYVILKVDNNVLRTGVKAIVQKGQGLTSGHQCYRTDLENMPPIFALVVQTLVHHFHDLDEVGPRSIRSTFS